MRPVLAVVLLSAALAAPVFAQDAQLGLATAAREALQANLDLAAKRRQLAAQREEIDLARAGLLPEIDLGARFQYIEDSRSDGERGSTSQRSTTLKAKATQVIYDDDTWADFEIQKNLFASRQQGFESFRLGVVSDAADAFLELDRARAVLAVQEANRALTRRNLQTSLHRIAAGYSSEREVLRWQSQLASNESAVIQAATDSLVIAFELNRVRNRSPETAISLQSATVEGYGFAYASTAIAAAVVQPDADRRLRSFMVRVGLDRSPVLRAIDSAIEAGKRQLSSDRRAFWIPTVAADAGVNHLVQKDSGSSNGQSITETEWGVGLGLVFPLFTGGAKFASLRQANEALSALRIQRRAAGQTLDQRIRAAFAQASGAFANISVTKEQRRVALRNFELVDESYVLGVASILSLLDAQSQLLNADLALTNATYDFLVGLIAAEQEAAFYPFLEPEADVEALVRQLELELQRKPETN